MLQHWMIGVLLATSCAAPVGLDQSLAPRSIPPSLPSPCHSINGRADSHCTPGLWAHSPEVTADAPKYLHTLCQPPLPQGSTEKRWIEKRRPPTAYTRRLEPQLIKAYGYTGDPANFELDHIGSLELDGDPGYTAYAPSGMPANLYPQPWEGLTGAKVKDREEGLLHRQVCSGALNLDQAQDKLLRDWVH